MKKIMPLLIILLFIVPKYSYAGSLSFESISVNEFDSASGTFKAPEQKMYFFNPMNDFLLLAKLKGLPEEGFDIKGVVVTINSGGKVRQLKNSDSYIVTNAKGVVYVPFYLGDGSNYCNAKNIITASLPGTQKQIKGELIVECGE